MPLRSMPLRFILNLPEIFRSLRFFGIFRSLHLDIRLIDDTSLKHAQAALVGVGSKLLSKEFRIKRGLQRAPAAF